MNVNLFVQGNYIGTASEDMGVVLTQHIACQGVEYDYQETTDAINLPDDDFNAALAVCRRNWKASKQNNFVTVADYQGQATPVKATTNGLLYI